MPPELGIFVTTGALLLISAFFVSAEYALVSVRKSSIDLLAKKGNRAAKALSAALQDLAPFVAGSQIAITMLGIALGLACEPQLTEILKSWFTASLGAATTARIGQGTTILSLILLTYFTVVFGELVPKYIGLRRAEQVALFTIQPLKLFIRLMKPLVWVVQSSGTAVTRLFGVKPTEGEDEGVSKDELLMMVRSGGDSGVFEKGQAVLISRALRLDVLTARDIMIHRLDVKWLDAGMSKDAVLAALPTMPFNRIPVCGGDIDDLVGVVYLHDIVKHLTHADFVLRDFARPAVVVPENLTLEKIVETMRREKTQMLFVTDEYGGTSGMLTLEDVVEEIFGELEDSLESERPPIRVMSGGRVSVKADLRYDELIDRLGLQVETPSTDTLATLVVDQLDRIPTTGDAIDTEIGLMRVENMARRRITRISLQLKPEQAAILAENPIA